MPPPGGSELAVSLITRGVTSGCELHGGQFRLGKLVDFSDLSSVWRACDVRSGSSENVIIKVARLHHPEAQHSIQREARVLADLQQGRVCQGNTHSSQTQQHGPARCSRAGAQFIVTLVGAFTDVAPTGAPLHCLVLEHLGTSLHKVMNSSLKAQDPHQHAPADASAPVQLQPTNVAPPDIGSSHLPVACAQHLARHLVQGVAYVHSRGWLHRDIKPGNIMTDKPVLVKLKGRRHAATTTSTRVDLSKLNSCTWKLVDFGNAQRYPAAHTPGNLAHVLHQPDSTHTGSKLQSHQSASAVTSSQPVLLQTLAYAPVEDLLGILPAPPAPHHPTRPTWDVQDGPPWVHPGNDMWSVGCVLYESVTGMKLLDARRCRALLLRHTPPAPPATPPPAPSWLVLPRWLPFPTQTTANSSASDDSSSCLPVSALCDEELHLWQMVHVMGPVNRQVLQRCSLEPAVTVLDPEGQARLDHHPTAQAVLKQAEQALSTWRDNPVQGLRQPGVCDSVVDPELSAVMPLEARLAVEAPHLQPAERHDLGDLLGQLLTYDPQHRLSAAQALDHPWLNKNSG